MKSLIESTYYDLLESGELEFKYQSVSKEEKIAYENLYATFSERQKKAFCDFEEKCCAGKCNAEREMYFQGFRMGAIMAFEILGIDFTFRKN